LSFVKYHHWLQSSAGAPHKEDGQSHLPLRYAILLKEEAAFG